MRALACVNGLVNAGVKGHQEVDMRTRMSTMFNIDAPIFAFSHCRDVVVEVSKAGGLGVLGATRYTPRELEIELSWIDEHIGGRPYGVDVLIPRQFTKAQAANVPPERTQ